jgi:hypothetical protein
MTTLVDERSNIMNKIKPPEIACLGEKRNGKNI